MNKETTLSYFYGDRNNLTLFLKKKPCLGIICKSEFKEEKMCYLVGSNISPWSKSEHITNELHGESYIKILFKSFIRIGSNE